MKKKSIEKLVNIKLTKKQDVYIVGGQNGKGRTPAPDGHERICTCGNGSDDNWVWTTGGMKCTECHM